MQSIKQDTRLFQSNAESLKGLWRGAEFTLKAKETGVWWQQAIAGDSVTQQRQRPDGLLMLSLFLSASFQQFAT